MTNDAPFAPLTDKLPRYTDALAQLARALSDRRAAHPGVSQQLGIGGLSSACFERRIALDIECVHGRVAIVADAEAFPALETIALDTEPKRAAALANLWLADLLARGRTDAAGTPSVKSIALSLEAAEVRGLGLRLGGDGTGLRCFVTDLPAALAADYEQTWVKKRGALACDALDDIHVPGVVRLRSRMCSPTLLASLRRHDVLIGWQHSDAPYVAGAPFMGASLRFGAPRARQLCATVRADTHTVTLETAVNYVNDAQADDLDAHAAVSAPGLDEPVVPVGEMDLPVHIEVLTVNLSVAQLTALQPGYVLDLPLPLQDATVRLVAYGQTIALGKLVAVGDNLGVQIERMAQSDERQS